ncbi:MAG: hypothetical protein K2K43_02840 [Alistipes sp.]|nr:hypothetical protein [Alistipes sp.]
MEYLRHLPYILRFEENNQSWRVDDREYRHIGDVKLTDAHITQFENKGIVSRDNTGKPYKIGLYLDKTYPIEKRAYWLKYSECLKILADAEMIEICD